jgi:cytoskeletal protein CcmA (bactofilin family)
MARRRGVRQVCVFGLLLAAFPSVVPAQEAGPAVVIRGTLTDNIYVAGGTVDVRGDVQRDLVAAGGTIDIGQLVEGDVSVAGGSVRLSGRVGDDVRAAGGTVLVGGEVGGDVVAAGGTVTLAPETRIDGRVWLGGGRVVVAGRIGRELRVAAAAVSVAGEVGGDVHIAARTIEVLPTARIKGDFTYTSAGPASIDRGAQIQGRVTHERSDVAERAGRLGRVVSVVARAVLLAGLIVCGAVLLLLLPGFTVSAARTIGSNPWRSLGLGVIVLVVTPIAAVALVVTIIGIPLGLTAIALYTVALVLGYLTAAVFLGELGARLAGRGELSTGGRMLALALALVVLALIGLVPIVGGLVVALAIVAGLGASSHQAFRRWSAARA